MKMKTYFNYKKYEGILRKLNVGSGHQYECVLYSESNDQLIEIPCSIISLLQINLKHTG